MIKIDETLTGKDLYQFLYTNKKDLIKQKKSAIKCCDAFGSIPMIGTKTATTKDATTSSDDVNTLHIKVVANTSMFLDSQSDVLGKSAGQKSIDERKGFIKALVDHSWLLNSQIGDVTDAYYQYLSYSKLGLGNDSKKAQILVVESDIYRDYDPQTFAKYQAGKVDQHSIGLQYVQLDLAINDEDFKSEKTLWDKQIGNIINQDQAIEQGYFWYVPEFKLLENSAVLFGANSITPTLSVTDVEPQSKSTQHQPSTANLASVINQFRKTL